MSEPIKDGGPAFPQPNHIVDHEAHGRVEARQWLQDSGMSLRDWFAGQALQGQLASLTSAAAVQTMREAHDPYAWAAESAYRFADAMLRAREAKP